MARRARTSRLTLVQLVNNAAAGQSFVPSVIGDSGRNAPQRPAPFGSAALDWPVRSVVAATGQDFLVPSYVQFIYRRIIRLTADGLPPSRVRDLELQPTGGNTRNSRELSMDGMDVRTGAGCFEHHLTAG
jgi:hypothetical protein